MAETTSAVDPGARLALLPTPAASETTTTLAASLILSTSVFSYTSVFSASDAAATAQISSSIVIESSLIYTHPSLSSSSAIPAFTSAALNGLYVSNATSSISSSSMSTATSSLAAFTTSSPVISTGAYATATIIPVAASTDRGLSRGAKAGIALAILALFMLSCAAILMLLKKRRSRWGLDMKKRGNRGSVVLSKGRDSDADSGFHEGDSDGLKGNGSIGGANGSGIGNLEVSVLSSVKSIWQRDGLERVGRYEDAERGLPLPRMEGDARRGKAKERGWT